ncbi:MAG: cytochrome P450 [Novosphingobium sp.]|nr:cytochrome P450 [Novosphingobium sp.]
MASSARVTDYRGFPSAQEVIARCLAENPEIFPPPVSEWDVGRAELFNEERWEPVFRRMRAEAPINKVSGAIHGDYWNVATLKPIVHVESLPELYSSSYVHGGVTMHDWPKDMSLDLALQSFISMDRPDHTERRRVVAQAFTPSEMVRLTDEVRERTGRLLDSLPEGEEFDWVSQVSVRLTTAMLAVIFDFPREDMDLLGFWSDWVGAIEAGKIPEVTQGRTRAKTEMADYFRELWAERARQGERNDLLSRMIHSDALGDLGDIEFTGTMTTLVTGGNDTTRNTMSGLVHALHLFPDQRTLLESNPSLAATAVPEVIRWVSPLVHMRRTALADADLFGHEIKAGDKLVLWYISANRDESVFDDPDRFWIERPNARRHVAFGYGIHRCVGARLAELQLRVLIEELLAKRVRVHLAGEPQRCGGAFLHGYHRLPVTVERY